MLLSVVIGMNILVAKITPKPVGLVPSHSGLATQDLIVYTRAVSKSGYEKMVPVLRPETGVRRRIITSRIDSDCEISPKGASNTRKPVWLSEQTGLPSQRACKPIGGLGPGRVIPPKSTPTPEQARWRRRKPVWQAENVTLPTKVFRYSNVSREHPAEVIEVDDWEIVD
ncbi:hypothetical protein K438DRAFT_1761817 [Mycena galopus ATCC 62051]|nr:hypothetical protein K438DRAFT_1761817 [Mycena galopus ATCC 62051]